MNADLERVEQSLRRLLQGKQFEIDNLLDSCPPLFLLLDSKPDLVGFASVNGQPKQGYERALVAFKHLYAERANEWPEHDLTLVLCTQEADAATRAHWNEIELNRYFCRKVVIDLNESVDDQVRRLPFVPLSPVNVVNITGLERPVSAENLLKRHAVAPSLAESLTVAGNGPETIVNRCLVGLMGPPELSELVSDQPDATPRRQQPKVRIKEIQIKNFRAYRSQTLNLDSDIVVVYGPNGLGKTSLYDAIDFVFTGGIARFDERFGRKCESHLIATMTHLGSIDEEAQVEARVSVEGKEFSIQRRVSSSNTAVIDGIPLQRKKALAQLLGLIAVDKMKLRVDNLVRLFRATHLFGQDSASLTSQVHDSSLVPHDTVSRMLALQDYVEALNKAKRISNELAARTKLSKAEIGQLSDVIRDGNEQLRKLRKAATSHDTPESVSAKGHAIVNQLIEYGLMPLDAAGAEITPAAVLEWRALLEGDIQRISGELERHVAIQHALPEWEKLYDSAGNATRRLESITQQLSKIQISRAERRERLNAVDDQLRLALQEREELLVRRDSIRWLQENQSSYKKVRKALADVENNIRKARLQLSDAELAVEKAAAACRLVDERVNESRQEIELIENERSKLSSFVLTIPDWRGALSTLTELSKWIPLKETERARASKEVDDSRSAMESALTTEKLACSLVDDLQQGQSELQTLLDSILRHAADGLCPVCGTRHQSQEDLVSRINGQRESQPAGLSSALVRVDSARRRVASCREAVELRTTTLLAITRELTSLKEQFEVSQTKLDVCCSMARALSLNADLTPDSCEAAAQSAAYALSQRLKDRRAQLETHLSEAAEWQQIAQEESERRMTKSLELSEMASSHQGLVNTLSDIQHSAEKRHIDLSQDQPSARREVDSINDRMEGNKRLADDALEQMRTLRPIVKQNDLTIGHLEEEIKQTRSDRDRSHERLRELQQLLVLNGFEPNAEANDLSVVHGSLEDKLSTRGLLRDEIVSFEVTLDAAHTESTVVRLQDDIRKTELRKEIADAKLRQMNEWSRYFGQIQNILLDFQLTSLRQYIEQYSPLASTIQQRLRPVFGFRGMRLTAQKDGLEVTVERAGQEYAPSDYFSESQLQIVMLSLFLSAVLTQTWSASGLVLLDDPVMHFDDLNAYAFLDLVRGLIDQPGEGHQVILSTCEERLYRLMRNRLSKAQANVSFYEFQAIGENGPVIRRA